MSTQASSLQQIVNDFGNGKGIIDNATPQETTSTGPRTAQQVFQPTNYLPGTPPPSALSQPDSEKRKDPSPTKTSSPEIRLDDDFGRY